MNCATSATSATFFNSCKVPPELADRIIDFLHDDPASLRTCSLTCRSWVHSSRYHIFHFIELSALRHYIAFARLLKTAPCLGRYVRSMVIQMHPDLLHAHSQGMLLTDIACRLGDVRRLVIMGVSNPVDHETLAQFGPVSELTICSSFAHPSDVVALFAAFPAVQDVVFMSLKPRENGAVGVVQMLPMLPLKRLRLVRSCSAVLPVLAVQPLPPLEELTTYITGADGYNEFCDFLRLVGPSLRLLHLHINFEAHMESSTLSESFASCTALRTVHFTTFPDVAWTVALLGKLVSPHIEKLMFDVHNIISGKWVALLADLVSVLAQARLQDAKSIMFKFRSVSLSANAALGRESITEAMQMIFVDLHQKGILTITFGDA